MLDSIDLNDDRQQSLGPRQPPPVPPSPGTPVRRDTHPSISVEQAAKPTFEILVGDPHKVGDLTSSHIEYQVRTKVRCSVSKVYRDGLIGLRPLPKLIVHLNLQ